MSKVFIDTNILVYAMDQADPTKQAQARQILSELRGEPVSGVISTQILQEFYIVATRKLGLDPLLVKSILHSLENFEVVVIDLDIIEAAIDCSVLSRISYWDALVVVSAEKAHCERILSEDLNPGQVIRGVRIVNPFVETGPTKLHESSEEYTGVPGN